MAVLEGAKAPGHLLPQPDLWTDLRPTREIWGEDFIMPTGAERLAAVLEANAENARLAAERQ